jgi:hypothetical protein
VSESPNVPAEASASPAGLDAIRLTIAFLPPVTLITGLLFYFGWTRVHFQATDMGQSEDIYGYSTVDYVLRSVDSLFFPLLVLVMLAILLVLGHRWVVRAMRDDSPAWLPGAAMTLIIGGLVVCVISVVLALGLITVPTPEGEMSRLFKCVFVGAPLAIGLGVLAVAYGGWLRSQVKGADVDQGPWWQRVFLSGALTIFAALILFWTVGNYAQVRGFELAEWTLGNYRSFPGVEVHSARDIGLSATAKMTRSVDPDVEYPFAYTCLRLLDHVAGVWYLMPDNWDDNSRLVILREDPSLRFELVWPSDVPSCPSPSASA